LSALLIGLLVQEYDPPKRRLSKEKAEILQELAEARDAEEERRFNELDAKRARKDSSVPSDDG
jgi:hypothetical protein